MSDSESENKRRDTVIARNEAQREAVSSLRVSSWAIGIAIIAGLVVFAIAWAWMHR